MGSLRREVHKKIKNLHGVEIFSGPHGPHGLTAHGSRLGTKGLHFAPLVAAANVVIASARAATRCGHRAQRVRSACCAAP